MTIVSAFLLAAVAGSVAFAARRNRRGGAQPSVPRAAAFLDTAPWWQRLVATGAVLLASAAFLQVLGWSVDLVGGYEKAQRSTARQLRELTAPRWTELRLSAGRDLVWYAPSYPLWGTLVVLVTGHRQCRPDADPSDDRTGGGRVASCRLGRLGVATIGALIVAGAADIAETSLFRTSLGRLRRHGVAADIGALTSLTRVLYAVKWLAVLVSLVLVITGFFVRGRPDRPASDADVAG